MQRSFRHALLLSLLTLGACGPEPADPSTPDADPLAAMEVIFQEQRFKDLVELLQGVRASEQLGPLATLRLAQAQVALGEVPKAELTAREGVKAYPDYHPLGLLLAEIYAQINQHRMAADALKVARANGCPDEDTALFLGVCLGRLLDLDGARAEFERARAAGVAESEINYNLAVLLHQQEQDAEAETLLRQVLKSEPDHPFAERELARVLLVGATGVDPRLDEAELLLNTSLDRDFEDWRTYELFGDASMVREDFDAAVAYYTEALRYGRNPEHVEDKYRAAAIARKAWLVEQGILEPKEPGSGKTLPDKVKDSMEHLRHGQQQGAGDPKKEGR